MATISIELDEDRKYRVQELSDANIDDTIDVASVLNRATYPKRLLAGLDDLTLEELEHALRSSRVLAVGLRLTNVCNYDCIYCGTADKRGRDPATVLTTAEYKDLITQAAGLGARAIIFGANGEPLMHRDVLELFEHVHAQGLTPITFSNISVIGNDVMCQRLHGVPGDVFLAKLDAAGTTLIISAESIQEDRYNYIMGVNTYKYFALAVERIRASGLVRPREFAGRPLCRTALSCVIMPINYEERHDMVEFAHSLNAAAILKPPSLHGSAAANHTEMFDPGAVTRIRPEVEQLSDKQATLQILTLACASWTLSFNLDNEGRFMSCMTEEVNPFGDDRNARNTRLAELVRRRNELVKLRNSICPVKDKYYRRSADGMILEEDASQPDANSHAGLVGPSQLLHKLRPQA